MVELQLPQSRIDLLRKLAHNSFYSIYHNRLPNDLTPASIGRSDDEHFSNGMVWIKDNARAIKFVLDPHFRQAFPELTDQSKQLYLSSIRALLSIQGQPEQLRRLQNVPGPADHNGYSTIDDNQVPAIKFDRFGNIYQDWGHNQPDNWGTLLMVAGRGIEADWPVLAEDSNQLLPLGAILQEITSYVVNLRTERLVCRSIWEHNKVWSSYSTRRIVLAGLDQMFQIWPEIVSDSKIRDYPLKLSNNQIQDASERLREKVKEHFPADYTDLNHDSTADLASLVVLNDINLPDDEQSEIIRRVFDPENNLENRQGFFRYLGDHWKRGRAEAKWTMGKPITARYFFNQAIKRYASGNPVEASRDLEHALDKVYDIIIVWQEYGYYPELFEDKKNDGIYIPNNNELAWTHGYIIEAGAAGIVATLAAQKFYEQAA